MATAVPETGNLTEEYKDEFETGSTDAGTISRSHAMPFGAEVRPDGCVRFRFFAPAAENVRLALEGRAEPLPMHAIGDGWHELVTSEAGTGSLYRFVLPDGTQVADPASRFQPKAVTGPSEVIAPGSYLWTDGAWEGRAWREAVLYELHIGAFTPEGTFKAAIEKLDHLASLGVTVLEIMPTARSRLGPKWSVMSPMAEGVKAPPPRACTARSPTRM